uniref:S1-like domain-containing protein n=1 Tax=Craspedostauros australis TaxID=1486917 RepID=A0A7R9X155_9STRA|mmetsp:Transcript_5135/g.13804  ORF Transcript_5135/g.13804 Transcript_5135/m.13804 type:complete len:204 (+) Transcript_5135:147-758(+)|eukprot:CAMPEP_0198128834 /NCGR_PEP_ID=MMETSP1442-20131203/50291_1 /TAXON_ID= /ORGANISM="Craspedostauros australis, Strain CCMP3328" /LENGTH=203 /DNA_ID=CAMNT_0043789081 /DNA_START=124 /DNA_END=735 /DNA_ORIENTATION=+
MAGLGRRTHYRKHLTDSVLNDLPEPEADERIGKVVATRGGNQFDIILATHSDTTTQPRKPQLAILPTKFHKLVWVKRNDYIIVQGGMTAEEGETQKAANGTSGIRYIISHILYKDQVKHLKSKGLWPEHDEEFNASTTKSAQDDDPNRKREGDEADAVQEDEDGIVYSTAYDDINDDDLFVNTNRISKMAIEDSSSSSDEDSD